MTLQNHSQLLLESDLQHSCNHLCRWAGPTGPGQQRSILNLLSEPEKMRRSERRTDRQTEREREFMKSIKDVDTILLTETWWQHDLLTHCPPGYNEVMRAEHQGDLDEV